MIKPCIRNTFLAFVSGNVNEFMYGGIVRNQLTLRGLRTKEEGGSVLNEMLLTLGCFVFFVREVPEIFASCLEEPSFRP